jgi:SAM-dependent methyltransferase
MRCPDPASRPAPPRFLGFLALRGVHFVASRLCGGAVAGLAFDAKFGATPGGWQGHREPPEFIEAVALQARSFGARSARILVLGCGIAEFAGGLPADSFQSLLGIDLSPRAIAIARGAGDPGKTRFEVADMRTYRPPGPRDLVILSESIYYLGRRDAVALPARLRAENPGVIFLVTISQAARYRPYLEDIRDTAPTLIDDRPLVPGKERHIIIFR